MSNPSPQLLLGQVIGSRYRVQSLIGRGGMGMVYAAMHELTGRRVALKLMVTDNDDAPVLHDRFLSEARIAAAVRHPNIVDVLDMGLHGGAPFIVMELLEGRSLEQLMHAQPQQSFEQVLGWAFPIIGALATLHDAGIVHRDIKPSNIFMSTLPRHPMRPKLLDFGLARVVSDLRLTRSGTVIGTPLYMAPEHAAGLATGQQADVWSIGVVLYEALTGSSPFQYTDRSSLAMQVLAGVVRPLAELRPDLPEPACQAIGRALQRELPRRYQDMRLLAEGLLGAARVCNIPVPNDPDPIGLPDYGAWLTGRAHGSTTQEHVTPMPPKPLPPVSGVGATVPFGSPKTESKAAPPRRRAWWMAATLLVLLGLGLWWRTTRHTVVAHRRSSDVSAPVEASTLPSSGSGKDASLRPVVESLVERGNKSSEVPSSRPTAGQPNKRKANERPARKPAVDKAPGRGSDSDPDEVESEWK